MVISEEKLLFILDLSNNRPFKMLFNLVWGRQSQGSPLPASPLYSSSTASPIIILKQNSITHRPYIFQQNSIASIYFSRTASPIYTVLQQNSIVCSYTHPGRGDPWEWRLLQGVAARLLQVKKGTVNRVDGRPQIQALASD